MIEVQRDQHIHEILIPLFCRLIGAKTYLELGVFIGQCLFEVARNVPGIHATGVDLRPLNQFSDRNITFVQSSTEDYLKGLTNQQFDVVFIDANHAEEAVLNDIRLVFPFVSDHGLIILHDTYPIDESFTVPGLCGTSYKVPEILKRHISVMEWVTLPFHPGLTIIRKRTKQTFWE